MTDVKEKELLFNSSDEEGGDENTKQVVGDNAKGHGGH